MDKTLPKNIVLSVQNLCAGYGDYKIVTDISLAIEVGSISILMGPNGAGKSTLLRSIFNLADIHSGEIYYEKEKISDVPAHALLKKGIAFVSQGKINFSTLTIDENIRLGARFLNSAPDIELRIKEVYGIFPQLFDKKSQYAFSLSGGEQQMLAIARALMSQPKMLLMDEPSLGLSPKLVQEVFSLIQKIRDTFGTTILIVEHNLQSLFHVADYGYILVGGKLVAADNCENLKKSDILKKIFVGTLV